jgi:Family of unknown function (DUF5990)
VEGELPLRLTFVDPPPGVAYCLRRGKHELIPPTQRSEQSISFDLTVRVAGTKPDGSPNLLGPCTQRRPYGRILVVNIGTSAGQVDSCWTRAALVPLSGIGWESIKQTLATPGAILEARLPGRAPDGSPACATLKLLDGAWHVSPAVSPLPLGGGGG